MTDLYILKRGTVDPVSGLVFWKRNRAMRCGAEWLTPERFAIRSEKMRAHRAKWKANNIERYRAITALYRKNASKERTAAAAEWAKNNPEKRRVIVQRWKAKNIIAIRKRAVESQSRLLAASPLARVKKSLRNRIREVLRQSGFRKTSSTARMIGCDPSFLRQYIEARFLPGMAWSNYGKWHVDHVVPLAIAKDKAGLVRLFHYTNLRPLWATDNLRKKDKVLVQTEFAI